MAGGALIPIRTENNENRIADLLKITSGQTVTELAAGGVIMKCRGQQNCPYNDSCGYCNMPEALGPPPMNEPCYIEIAYLTMMYDGYRNEIMPDGGNWSVMCILKDIVVLELLIHRAEKALAVDGLLVEVVAVGIDKVSGQIVTRPEVSAHLEAWERLLKNKLRMLEQMGLTPKSRAAIGSTVAKDPSTFAAELVRGFEELMRKRLKEKGMIPNAAIELGPTGDSIIDVSPGRYGDGDDGRPGHNPFLDPEDGDDPGSDAHLDGEASDGLFPGDGYVETHFGGGANDGPGAAGDVWKFGQNVQANVGEPGNGVRREPVDTRPHSDEQGSCAGGREDDRPRAEGPDAEELGEDAADEGGRFAHSGSTPPW